MIEGLLQPNQLLKFNCLLPDQVKAHLQLSGHTQIEDGLFLAVAEDCFFDDGFLTYTLIAARGWSQLTLRKIDLNEFGSSVSGKALYLDDLYAYPQNLGLGSDLIGKVINVHPADVLSAHTNSRAKRFYERLKFQPIDPKMEAWGWLRFPNN